jgi:hypothetical protein
MMRRAQDVVDMEEMSNAHQILTQKTKIKDHLGGPSRERRIY